MPGTITINTALTWALKKIFLEFTLRDQAALVSGGGALPAEHVPDSKVQFVYRREDGEEETPVFGASGESVRGIVESGLTHALGNALVRGMLTGSLVDSPGEVWGGSLARQKMDGVTMDLGDGQSSFVVTADG